MEKFDRSKTHANVGTIGHVGHGETSLTAAIAKVLSRNINSKIEPPETKKEEDSAEEKDVEEK